MNDLMNQLKKSISANKKLFEIAAENSEQMIMKLPEEKREYFLSILKDIRSNNITQNDLMKLINDLKHASTDNS